MRKALLAIFILCSAYACNPSIRFETPQPLNGKNKTTFSENYMGRYMSDDSTCITITATSVIAQKKISFKLPKSEVDSSKTYKLKHDSLFTKGLKKGFPIHIYKDSVAGNWNYTDTLFNIGTKNILRHYRGEYYLNLMSEEGYWDVKRLAFHAKNELVLNSVYLQDDLERLKDITTVREVKKDSSKTANLYLVNPSRAQLRKFIRKGGFRRYDKFTKITAAK